MKKISLKTIAIFFLFFCGYSNAATYSVILENLPEPSEIESIELSFLVGTDFSYIKESLKMGSAVPVNDREGDSLFQWIFAENNPVVVNSEFVVELYNSDVMDVTPIFNGEEQSSDGNYNENNLIDGLLLSFEYEGAISFVEGDLNDFAGSPISYELAIAIQETADGLLISSPQSSAVPIPSAILLFGGGLLGLLGTRRKFKK